MAIALIVIAAVATLAVVVWFFVAHNPEQASTHDGAGGDADDALEESHFAPGDAGTEDQAVPRTGEPGPRRSPR